MKTLSALLFAVAAIFSILQGMRFYQEKGPGADICASAMTAWGGFCGFIAFQIFSTLPLLQQ